MNRVLYSSAVFTWRTPTAVYKALDDEFHFTLDPCPGEDAVWDGRVISWVNHRVYCNPPYGRGVGAWLAKAKEADIAVFLLPSRTDTVWWHDYVMTANEIRFIRGRLKFGKSIHNAPFPSAIIVFRKEHNEPSS